MFGDPLSIGLDTSFIIVKATRLCARRLSDVILGLRAWHVLALCSLLLLLLSLFFPLPSPPLFLSSLDDEFDHSDPDSEIAAIDTSHPSIFIEIDVQRTANVLSLRTTTATAVPLSSITLNGEAGHETSQTIVGPFTSPHRLRVRAAPSNS